VSVPEAPGEFFCEFLPLRFAELFAAERVARSRPSPRGVLVRVVGSGQWLLSLAGGRLVSVPAGEQTGALSISLRAEDFARLVLEPLRQAPVDLAPEQLALVLGKFGRWDDETTGLLENVPGSLLVRIADDGVVRPVAVTPGALQPSLEQGACTIDCSWQTLRELVSGRRSALDALYAGELKLSGDAQLALALGGAFLG
jgi:hypothetical protein